MDGYHEQGLE